MTHKTLANFKQFFLYNLVVLSGAKLNGRERGL